MNGWRFGLVMVLMALAATAAAAAVYASSGKSGADRFEDSDAKRLCTQGDAGEKANCELVVGWYDAFFNDHDIDSVKGVVGPYVQHNPYLPNGVAPLVEYFRPYFKQHPESTSEIVRVATNGDEVWLQVHEFNRPSERKRGTAVLDIFRVQGGRIVEHWDIIQKVPAKSANKNSMF